MPETSIMEQGKYFGMWTEAVKGSKPKHIYHTPAAHKPNLHTYEHCPSL